MVSEAKKKILIVDDEPNIRNSLRRALIENNFEVDEACDGIEAIAKAQVMIPDIIILDGRMPKMDGIEASKRLKGDPKTKDIPILFSTGTHVTDVLEGKVLADDYIVKPYGFEELYDKIKQLLHL